MGEEGGEVSSPSRTFTGNPGNPRMSQISHSPAHTHTRARDVAAELREVLAQREAEGRILTVRRASETLDVSQMEVANAAWRQGIPLAVMPNPAQRLAPVTHAGGMTEATVCAPALPGRNSHPLELCSVTQSVLHPLLATPAASSRRTTSTPPRRQENRSSLGALGSKVCHSPRRDGPVPGGRLRRARWNRRTEHGQTTSRTDGSALCRCVWRLGRRAGRSPAPVTTLTACPRCAPPVP